MPVCEGCGAAYDDQFQFCPHCGRAKPQPPTVRVEVQEARPRNACPICDRNDQVRKVTAIYAADTAHSKTSGSAVTTGSSSGSGEYRNRDGQYVGSASSSGSSFSVSTMSTSGIAQSDLARTVAPPGKPAEPVLERFSYAGFYFTWGVLIILGVFLFDAINRWSPGSWREWSIIYAAFHLVGSAILAIVIGSIIALGIARMVSVEPNREFKRKFDQQMAEHIQRVAAWEAAMQEWNSLYYCYRDDIVFGPGSEDHAPPSQTVAFCYRRK